MSIDRADFEGLDEADLKALLDAGVPEGIRLDYKRDNYADTGDARREFLKDSTAFANTNGGHILIGIDEEGGIPTTIPGMAGDDPDREVRRLESCLLNGVQPNLKGVRIRWVSFQGGRGVIAVRVPKSWHPPHRVVANGSNRFYMRNSSGVYEPDVEGLRTLFNFGTDLQTKLNQLRDERLLIIRSNLVRPLPSDGGKLVLHIVPLDVFSTGFQLDLEMASREGGSLAPIGGAGMETRMNLDGLINIRTGNPSHGYTQLFRNGVIEATKANIITQHPQSGQRFIHARNFERDIFGAFPRYLRALRTLQVPRPYAVMMTLEGVRSVPYLVDPNGPLPPSFEVNVVNLPSGLVEEQASSQADYDRVLRPAVDALWNSADCLQAESFNAQGEWVGA